ncbi:MAG: hypothetical protein ABIA74_05270 [bacterium]
MKLIKLFFLLFLISVFLKNHAQFTRQPSEMEEFEEISPQELNDLQNVATKTEEETIIEESGPEPEIQKVPSGPIQIFSKPENKKLAKKLSKWIPPDPRLRFDEICYLATHNCNSSYAYGYIPYAQQKLPIKEQLDIGVRCLLPDIWPTELQTNSECKRKENEPIDEYAKRATIRMCHGPCKINPYLRPKNTLKNLAKLKKIKKMVTPLFSEMLETVKNFLVSNPNEILTIFLENYADRDLVDYILKQIPGLTDLIFKPGDWIFKENNYYWPTIRWMIESNKRLVIFNDRSFDKETGENEQTKYTFPTWQYVIENMYGTTDKKARQERGESYDKKRPGWPRKLLLLNYFIKFPIPFDNKKHLIKFLKEFKDNTQYTKLNTIGIESLTNYIYMNGLDKRPEKPDKSSDTTQPGKYPNFIALDFVNKGNAIAIVNRINELQAQELIETEEQKISESKPSKFVKPQEPIKPEELEPKEKRKNIITQVINKIKSVLLPGY